jgi:hypothetical protein
MFGSRHYVPILRWKQAERFALRHLHEEDRKTITPLIELTPTIFKSRKTASREAMSLDPAHVLEQQAKNLLEACGNSPFFLDLRYVTAKVSRERGKVHALEYLAEVGRNYKLKLVPVAGLDRPVAKVEKSSGDRTEGSFVLAATRWDRLAEGDHVSGSSRY